MHRMSLGEFPKFQRKFFGAVWERSGAVQIAVNPEILAAFNPLHGVAFLGRAHLFEALLTLGALMLVVTGGEAMYADVGHFGALPIRLSWFAIVYPALLLNYLGQGAYRMGAARSPATSSSSRSRRLGLWRQWASSPPPRSSSPRRPSFPEHSRSFPRRSASTSFRNSTSSIPITCRRAKSTFRSSTGCSCSDA